MLDINDKLSKQTLKNINMQANGTKEKTEI